MPDTSTLRTRKHTHATSFGESTRNPDRRTMLPAHLRMATRHSEQHVIAGHALGRLSEARAARDIARYRQKLGAQLHQISYTTIGLSAGSSHQDTRRGVTDTPSVEPHDSPLTFEGLPRRDFRAVMT